MMHSWVVSEPLNTKNMCPIFYNCEASTMTETEQEDVFLTFVGHMAKTEKRLNTEPQGRRGFKGP